MDPRTAERLITDINQLSWPEPALPLRQLIRRCAELALSLAPLQAPPRIDEFDLYRISDAARILLSVRAAERAVTLLSEAATTSAHHAALRAALDWARAIGEGRIDLWRRLNVVTRDAWQVSAQDPAAVRTSTCRTIHFAHGGRARVTAHALR